MCVNIFHVCTERGSLFQLHLVGLSNGTCGELVCVLKFHSHLSLISHAVLKAFHHKMYQVVLMST